MATDRTCAVSSETVIFGNRSDRPTGLNSPAAGLAAFATSAAGRQGAGSLPVDATLPARGPFPDGRTLPLRLPVLPTFLGNRSDARYPARRVGVWKFPTSSILGIAFLHLASCRTLGRLDARA